MKKTFTSQELPHVWLRQSQVEGQTPGTHNFYFLDKTIFSYGGHFPIATLFDAPNGERVVLVTLRTRSVTTAKQVRDVKTALRGSCMRVVYCYLEQYNMTANTLEQLKTGIFDPAVKKMARARKPELYAADIRHAAALARDFCEVMTVPLPWWVHIADIPAGAPLLGAIKMHTPEVCTDIKRHTN